jgi:hypothetical protein
LSTTPQPSPSVWQSLTPEKQRFIKLFVVALVALYAAVTATGLSVIQGEKSTAHTNHALRMSPDKVEPGFTAADPLPPTGDFVRVSVGGYVDNIDSFSVKDSTWGATLYLWFRWKGDKNLDPAKGFQLTDARVDKRDVLEQHFGDDGVNYQRVRLTARFSKYFNTTRIPLDDHMLTITAEDARDGTKVRYELDADSGISSRVKVAGYTVTNFATVVKNHTYKSAYGDPRVAAGTRKTFTSFVMGISVKRASAGTYLKLLIGLFAGILLTLCSFFIRPSDTSPRFSLPTASYFGAVANSYIVSSTLPSTGQFGLIDYVTGLGLFTIFVCMSASLLSGYYYIVKKEENFSKMIDRATRTTILIVYVLANIILPASAYTSF